QIIQQRAEHWLESVYELSCEVYESYGKKVSQQFDRALWAYHIEPFIMREVKVDEYPYAVSMLFELLLRAVGSPPGKRNQLKVGQKDCCLDIRNKIHQMWHDKLHHVPPRIEFAAAMVRVQAQERAALTIPVELSPQLPPQKIAPDQKPTEPQATPKQTLPVVPPLPKDMRSESSEMKAVQLPEAPPGAKSPVAVDWGDIEITFLSDERVQIRAGKKTETRNYAEFGFQDGRTHNPTRAWQTFRRLAELGGNIKSEKEAQEPWPKVEKRV